MARKTYRAVSAATILVLIMGLGGALRAEPCRTDAAIIAGRVTHVRDGDTIVVAGVPIRLQGVAAPELHDPLGAEAGRFMRRLVDGQEVSCAPDGTRSYDRLVAVCRLEGEDIGAIIIAAGLARDCHHYSRGRYADDEQKGRVIGTRIAALYPLPRYC